MTSNTMPALSRCPAWCTDPARHGWEYGKEWQLVRSHGTEHYVVVGEGPDSVECWLQGEEYAGQVTSMPLEVRIGDAKVTLAQAQRFIADLTKLVDVGLHIAASGPLVPVNPALTVEDVETLDAMAFGFANDAFDEVDRDEIDLATDEGDLARVRAVLVSNGALETYRNTPPNERTVVRET